MRFASPIPTEKLHNENRGLKEFPSLCSFISPVKNRNCFRYSSSASNRSLARKMSEIHQMPANATTVYTIRLPNAV